MAAKHVINVDLAKVYKEPNTRAVLITILGWGDEVEVLGEQDDFLRVRCTYFVPQLDSGIKPESSEGFISLKKMSHEEVVIKKSESRVLKIDFVDVQQGDGAVIETPGGRVVLIDGGDNQLFARFLANRFHGTSPEQRREIDCILVTHGDADHFKGLFRILDSEGSEEFPPKSDFPAGEEYKRIFIRPKRVFHNGLVKRPKKKNDGSNRKEWELLGPVEEVDGKLILTGLETNLLEIDDAEMNKEFKRWKKVLSVYNDRNKLEFQRISAGDDKKFKFLGEGIKVEVLGPMMEEGGLKFLGSPKPGPRIGQESLNLGNEGLSSSPSASHTINGHSIIFRLTYGDFSFLFTGDLNDEAGRALTRRHNRGEITLQSDVFKVPHHGSADFSGAFIQAVAPVISVVSSGDESARKEYIHPRATLMGALGRYSRVEEPLIFVTELVAFFSVVGYVRPEFHKIKGKGDDEICVVVDGVAQVDEEAEKRFFAFRRTALGIVMVRTDGKRLMAYTNSGLVDMKEAYAYEIDDWGKPRPKEVVQT